MCNWDMVGDITNKVRHDRNSNEEIMINDNSFRGVPYLQTNYYDVKSHRSVKFLD